MSGGRFNYIQNRLDWEVIEELEEIIERNSDGEVRGEDYRDSEYFVEYSPKTVEEFRKGLDLVKRAQVYMQRIDWLVSGDDGEETFQKRLTEDLAKIERPFEPMLVIESFGFRELQPGLFEKQAGRDPWITYWIQLKQSVEHGVAALRIGQDVASHEDVLFSGSIKSLSELETLFRQIGIETV
jgi:hypothetical protein